MPTSPSRPSASIPHAFAPAALRASLASRGQPCGLSPPRVAWRPSIPPNRLVPDRPGQHSTRGPTAVGRWRRVRCDLLRQVARKRAVLDAGGQCSACHEGRFTDIPPGLAGFACRAWEPAAAGSPGRCPAVVGGGLAGVRGVPAQPSCGDAESAMSPCGVRVRPKASLSRCESWRWRGLHVCNLPDQIISPPLCGSSRDKLLDLPGAPLRCARKRCSQPFPRRTDRNKDAMGATLVQPP